MNHDISPLGTSECTHSSSMSELDSLSDSDWLDISSSRESDDNDSIISGDSDRDDVGFMPLSRRSSVSVGSSREGDVEAWEGFVDDSGDEEARLSELGMAVTAPTAAIEESASTTPAAVVTDEHDLAEEQRVKEALDQSMISTLSASRSGSTTTHNSLRDLRLSFPDPLTSSHSELNRSYDDVSPSETTSTATDIATDGVIDVDNPFNELPAEPLCKEDPGSFITTPEITKHGVQVYSGDSKAEFEVVLYGSPSPIKWTFVQELLRKAVTASGRTLTSTTVCANNSTRYLHLERQIDDSLSISEFIPVHDRTDNVMNFDAPVPQALIKRPSLAIIYLPSAIHALPDHTLYLPVLIPSASPTEINAAGAIARRDWESLSIPASKIACLNGGTASPIVDGQNVGEIHHMRAHRLLQRLVSQAKKIPTKSISEHLGSVHAVTLFALVTLIVGFTMNTTFRRPSTSSPTPTTEPPATCTNLVSIWRKFGPEVNSTSVVATVARDNAPVITTASKDFSLSLFIPGTTSLSLTSHGKHAVASTSATPEAGSHMRPSTWADKVKSARDVIVRPTTQLSGDMKPSMTMISTPKQDGPSSSTSTALSLVVESLSEVLDVHVKAIRSDIDELMESIDELGRAIRRQTTSRMQQSKGKAKEIGEQVHYRHDRAKGKAKELRKKGEEIIASAGEQIERRTTIARKKAREISKSVVTSDAWRAYQKAHAEWNSLLKEKGGEGGGSRAKKTRTTSRVERKRSSSFFSYTEIHLA
ncbi:hypothetical protein Hypma_006543 [Hypsizygus marmoreus]|uniref:Uncharacterized protein n=1 Tax=Hypsizygus marmoreus TaxID=39966 RepID=A0A369JZV9_HYPMA|nr:hypothetical protein Hypma_006543 [Hypsizygus marmoreus]